MNSPISQRLFLGLFLVNALVIFTVLQYQPVEYFFVHQISTSNAGGFVDDDGFQYSASNIPPQWKAALKKSLRDARNRQQISQQQQQKIRRNIKLLQTESGGNHNCYQHFRQQFPKNLDCDRIFGDKLDIATTNTYSQWKPTHSFSDEQMMQMTEGNCSRFKSNFCFPIKPNSDAELNFPIAYVMVAHKNLEQISRLLSSVYWPQNLYCLTYDTKSSDFVKKFMKNLVNNCYPSNIILPEKHENIHWGGIGVLQASLNCMRELALLKNHHWKYVQTVTYSDLPLKTNYEMVEILQTFRGANDMELKKGQPSRYTYHVQFLPEGTNMKPYEGSNGRFLIPGLNGKFFVNTSYPKTHPPGDLTIYKGSWASTLARKTVEFALTNPVAQKLAEWLKDTHVPDEQYWSTLIHNPKIGTPGSFPPECIQSNREKKFISRFQVWPAMKKTTKCHGTWAHGSCVFGVTDLNQLIHQPHLIAHKFYLSFQPAAYYCIQRWHMEKTYSNRERTKKRLNREYYETLDAVKLQKHELAC